MKLDLKTLLDPCQEMTRSERRRANRAVRAADRRRRTNPLLHAARPHYTQELVHLFEKKQCLLVAANRFGKSTCGVWEVLWRATNTHPYRELRPHHTIWCGFPSYKFYKRVTKRLFKLWMPEDYLLDTNETEGRMTFRREGGGVCDVFFLSYDSDQDAWAGGAVDFIWLDEEPPEDISREAFARTIDTRGQILRTYTPVSGMGWSYDQLYLPGIQGKRDIEVIEGALARWDPDAYLNVGESMVPHLTRADVILFAEEYPDEAERLIRIFGKYAKRAGLIYRAFDPAVHVVSGVEVTPDWLLVGTVDPGFHGFGALLAGIAPDGRVVVLDEYYSQGERTSVRLQALADMVVRHQPAGPSVEPVIFLTDTEDPQTTMELNLLAAAQGMNLSFTQLQQGLKAEKAGLTRVQQQLHPSPKRDKPKWLTRPGGYDAGEPTIYFRKGMHSVWKTNERMEEGSRLLYEMQRLMWAVVKGESRDHADKLSADGAHLLDCLRYLVMSRFGPVGVEEEEVNQDGIWAEVQELDERVMQQREGLI